ncbi:hypothetical protein KOR42_33850 [Thalassoglobus neptunius]|uniref:Uncharacterized protein n=1 Tax=Thalassoglobus neptunius TaxID=1938619 RepID=A0A5C5WNM3_9PLAN|nr:hypothetical protein [Thalassoglobus neptunius]TWT51699.1 hypothetical protein KOR42_33850 [Thalassoglobus neptunius]
MCFSLHNNLFSFFSNRILVAVLIVSVSLTSFQPIFAATNGSTAAEYEAWGLEAPSNSGGRSTQPAQTTPSNPPSNSDRFSAHSPNNPDVPTELADRISQSMVQVIAVDAEDNKFATAGWVVDFERGIVMTNRFILEGAKTVVIIFPGTTGEDVQGSVARVLNYSTDMDVAYVQSINPLPNSLRGLGGSSPAPVAQPQQQYPQQQTQQQQQSQQVSYVPEPGSAFTPIVGTWSLQDNLNGYQIHMVVHFTAQGEYGMQTTIIDQYGQQSKEIERGAYVANSSGLLVMETNEGIQELPFWFENGCLCVNLQDQGLTLYFNKN